jgi:hypothetical protein
MTSLLLSAIFVIGGLPLLPVYPGDIVSFSTNRLMPQPASVKAKPEVDPANPKTFTVACPDAAGNEVVVYHFTQTRAGWKFTALDNLNE